MKCNNCQIPIPPSFTKALQDNLCPACGKPIMSANLFKEFSAIKDKLADADVDEATLVKVASLIAGRYDLVPRGTSSIGRAMTTAAASRPSKTTAQMKEDEIESELMEEYPQLKQMSPEERKREILAIRAEAEREFALSQGEMMTAREIKDSGRSAPLEYSEFDGLTTIVGGPIQPAYGDLDGPMDPLTAERMAKLAALKSSPSVNRFRRADG